jgi:hypothetical protein
MALQIRRAQMRQMVGGDEAMLLGALERLVREDHARVLSGMPAHLVQQMLRNGVEAAHRYGLVEPSDVATFVLLMFEFGPGFHRHPAVLDKLTDRALPAHVRLQRVVDETPEAVWREIESKLHEQHWF